MKIKVTVSIDEGLLGALDELVQAEKFDSRSASMEAAITRLLDAQADAAFELALSEVTPEDVVEMRAMAEEGMDDWSEIVSRNEW